MSAVVVAALAIGAGFVVASVPDAGEPASAVGADTATPTTEQTQSIPVDRIMPDDTALGAVELAVADVAGMRDFYRDVVGLDVLSNDDTSAVLGTDGTEVLRLVATDAAAPTATDAGLYHTAFLYADEPTLAQALLRLAEQAPELYQGSADHAVSLAFYLADPEGNGIELYVDRPREEWEWTDGRVTMGSAALDPNAFIAEHVEGEASGSFDVGHMHLKVGDLDEARAFYADTLGFDVTSEVEGAVFYSAGGYHHHIATNTWASAGAAERGDTAGLGALTVTLPAAADVDEVRARVDAAGHAYTEIDGGIAVDDPWGTTIRIVTA